MPPRKKKKLSRTKRGCKQWEPSPEEMAIIEEVASLGGSMNMAATLCGVSHHVFDENKGLRQLFGKKNEEGRLDLLRLQHDTAKSNPTLQIWLGKNRLDQCDKAKIDQHNTGAASQVHVYIPDNGRK